MSCVPGHTEPVSNAQHEAVRGHTHTHTLSLLTWMDTAFLVHSPSFQKEKDMAHWQPLLRSAGSSKQLNWKLNKFQNGTV